MKTIPFSKKSESQKRNNHNFKVVIKTGESQVTSTLEKLRKIDPSGRYQVSYVYGYKSPGFPALIHFRFSDEKTLDKLRSEFEIKEFYKFVSKDHEELAGKKGILLRKTLYWNKYRYRFKYKCGWHQIRILDQELDKLNFSFRISKPAWGDYIFVYFETESDAVLFKITHLEQIVGSNQLFYLRKQESSELPRSIRLRGFLTSCKEFFLLR